MEIENSKEYEKFKKEVIEILQDESIFVIPDEITDKIIDIPEIEEWLDK